MATLQVALLHLAPLAGEIAHNRRLVERAVTRAAKAGAEWIVTPELVISGYGFAKLIGTAWIVPQPDAWMTGFCDRVKALGVTVFLGHPERDAVTQELHNTVFVIDARGEIVGSQRKMNPLPLGSEAWSKPGAHAKTITVTQGAVGVMICADAYPPTIAAQFHAQGAKFLVSSAAWATGLHGPEGEWEQRTLETGLPLFVCNRTGIDPVLDFTKAESVIAYGGTRLKTFQSQVSAIFIFGWDMDNQRLAGDPTTILLAETWEPNLQTLETERVILHPMTPGDVDALLEIFADPKVMASFNEPPFVRTQMEQWVNRNLAHQTEFGYGLFSVIHKESDVLIGDCGLEQMDLDGEQAAELGYDFRSDYWKQGYATEAARAVRDYAFGTLKLAQLISLIRVGNDASRRVAERVGMKLLSEYEHYGRPYWKFGLARQDWAQADKDATA